MLYRFLSREIARRFFHRLRRRVRRGWFRCALRAFARWRSRSVYSWCFAQRAGAQTSGIHR